MFDISALKEMKLAELQEIAKLSKTIKITGVKKDTLIAQILELQNNAVTIEKPQAELEMQADNKAKRTRILPETKKNGETLQNNLFVEEVAPIEKTTFQNKNSKFKNPIFEKKKNNSAEITLPEQTTIEELKVTEKSNIEGSGISKREGQMEINSNSNDEVNQIQKPKQKKDFESVSELY